MPIDGNSKTVKQESERAEKCLSGRAQVLMFVMLSLQSSMESARSPKQSLNHPKIQLNVWLCNRYLYQSEDNLYQSERSTTAAVTPL